MKHRPLLAVADWAHPSWLEEAAPARTERSRAEAASRLFARFPQLPHAGTTQLPWFAAPLARPACARLMRLCAALACACSLRVVVCAVARTQFSRTTGLPWLTALQCHPRGERDDLPLDAPLDFFDRHALTAAGLAFALRATAGAAQRQWMQLRLPRDCAEAAKRWRLPDIAPHTALELVGDALQLLHARRTPC